MYTEEWSQMYVVLVVSSILFPFVASSSNAKGLGLVLFVSVPKAFHSLQCTVSPHSTGNLCVAVILHCCSCALVTFFWSLLDDIAVQALLACFAVQFTILSSWGLQSDMSRPRWGVPPWVFLNRRGRGSMCRYSDVSSNYWLMIFSRCLFLKKYKIVI